jgi:hypothetical protein
MGPYFPLFETPISQCAPDSRQFWQGCCSTTLQRTRRALHVTQALLARGLTTRCIWGFELMIDGDIRPIAYCAFVNFRTEESGERNVSTTDNRVRLPYSRDNTVPRIGRQIWMTMILTGMNRDQ